jgi:hypothetical protein
MTRGFVRVTGLARVTLSLFVMAVAANIRELENWAAKYDDGRAKGHPLLRPRDEYVVLHLPHQDAREYELWRASR